MDLPEQPQYWYFAFGLAWSLFQGLRGVVEARLVHRESRAWRRWERIVVLYVPEFAFRVVCTLAGFVALYMAVILFNETDPELELPFVDSLVMLLLFVLGVTGIGGQLHRVLLFGRRGWLTAR
jgi:sterol desaturase/sphingolipid hydroxylase (fatty acid hydroxylase superfamily)